MSSANGKDASNLALIYSTLAVMGKKMEQQQQGKDLSFPLPADSNVQIHPHRSNDVATVSASANVYQKPSAVGSTGVAAADAETMTTYSKKFDCLVEQFKNTISSPNDAGGDEIQPSGEPALVSADSETNLISIFLKHEFVMEFKLLIDGEVGQQSSIPTDQLRYHFHFDFLVLSVLYSYASAIP